MKQLLIALICIGLTSCGKVKNWQIKQASKMCKEVSSEIDWIRSGGDLAVCLNGITVIPVAPHK